MTRRTKIFRSVLKILRRKRRYRDFLLLLTKFLIGKDISLRVCTRVQKLSDARENVGVTQEKWQMGKSRWPTTRVISKQQRGYCGPAN